MTTREYLDQIRKLSLMIEAKLDERYKLMSLACRITVPTDGDRVKSSSDPDRLTNIVEKIIKCEKEIDFLIDETLVKRKEIISQIDNIENPATYGILTYRYVQFLSDKEIADKMHVALSSVYKIQKAALIEFEMKYGHIYLTTGDIYERDRKRVE